MKHFSTLFWACSDSTIQYLICVAISLLQSTGEETAKTYVCYWEKHACKICYQAAMICHQFLFSMTRYWHWNIEKVISIPWIIFEYCIYILHLELAPSINTSYSSDDCIQLQHNSYHEHVRKERENPEIKSNKYSNQSLQTHA